MRLETCRGVYVYYNIVAFITKCVRFVGLHCSSYITMQGMEKFGSICANN